MKALSIKQPWIWLILHSGKDVENRSWTSDHRGWLALHASAHSARPPFKLPRGVCIPDLKSLKYSAICGVALVVDITPKSRSKWFQHPEDGRINYGWVLANVTPLPEPIACKGALRLWTVPPKVLRAIQRQLPKIDFSDG